MLDLTSLTADAFMPHIGTDFLAAGTELRLGECRVLGAPYAPSARAPFSLTFVGPAGLRLEQGIRQLSHSAMGEMEFFLTQLADRPTGSEFEAIFS